MPKKTDDIMKLWTKMLQNTDYHIIVAQKDKK